MKTVFLRVLEAEDKATALLEAVREPERARGRERFEVDSGAFALVPRSPFTYWVSERLRKLFKDLPCFEEQGRTAKQGLATADDFRFVRGWWAVSAKHFRARWFPFAKGGKFSPFYADIYLCVNYSEDGRELDAFPGSVIRNPSYYFRPGLTWPARPYRRGAFSLVAEGAVFSHTGTMVFTDHESELAPLACLLNSDPFIGLLHFLMPRGGEGSDRTLKYEVGYVTSVPVPRCAPDTQAQLTRLFRRAWSLKRSFETPNETSHAFVLPALLQNAGTDVAVRAARWSEHVHTIDAELAGIQAEINVRCFALYGIDEVDRRSLTEGLGGAGPEFQSRVETSEVADDPEEDREEDDSVADEANLAAELLSWCVGVSFGRFDVRLVTGARTIPKEPEPFDPLPACSPGMLVGDDRLPLARSPAGYPLAIPEIGVRVDDPGHAQDLTAAMRAVFDVVFGTNADHWWNDVTALLDPKRQDLRVWLAAGFFEHHLKRYSKSHRKAPIFWQLSTPSGRYSVWLYAHRLTRDSFFQLQNEVIGPKLIHEERQLTTLIQNADRSPSASARREIAAQESFVDELRAMLDEVKRIAPLWNPHLDDGVVLTMAPLWRLVPQHKSWQRELKAKWDELAAGRFDWAHLAMHLWPERVVPKCATDRSFAIAHGLEDTFWVKGSDGKWTARKKPTRLIDELVRDRTSLAVRAALKNLLEAPLAAGNGHRGVRRRAAAIEDEGAR
jgi:hypothetical protein